MGGLCLAAAGRAGSGPVARGLRLLPAVAVAALVVGPGRQVGHADAVLAALVVANHHRLRVDLGTQHRHRALPGAEHGADRRQALCAVAVLGQLIRQAAHEPPARARDLAGVQGELLLARHLERDRVEILEPGGAAERAPARPAAVHAPRLVAHPDLAQLDPGVKLGGQVLHQLAEIDPVLGGYDDFVAETEPEVARVEEELLARAAQGYLHDLAHGSLYGRQSRPYQPA